MVLTTIRRGRREGVAVVISLMSRVTTLSLNVRQKKGGGKKDKNEGASSCSSAIPREKKIPSASVKREKGGKRGYQQFLFERRSCPGGEGTNPALGVHHRERKSEGVRVPWQRA